MGTILIAAVVSIVVSIFILGVTAIVIYRFKRREQKTSENNVYQISSATSSASSSYMQYSSSTSQHSLLQPVPVLQTWQPAHLTGEELYVDIDGQAKQQQQSQYQQQIPHHQLTAHQNQHLGGHQHQHQSQTSHLQPFLQRQQV